MRKLYMFICAMVFSIASYAIGPITGNLNVCVGASTTLADTPAGGTWTSSAPAVATIGSATGIVSGLTAGTTTITYTTATETATAVVTVHAAPGACPQPPACVGVADTLIGCATPGYWLAPVIMVDTPTGKGYFTSATSGTVTVTYTVELSGCQVSTVITVNPAPSAGTIEGDATMCISSTTTFTNALAGGTWSSSNPTVANVGPTDGIVAGLSAGAATISYSVTTACGVAVATKVINVVTTASAGTISGPSGVCVGLSDTLESSIGGGVWSSSIPAIASITGVVSGLTVGTATISYTVTLPCGVAVTTRTITVSSSGGVIHSSPGIPSSPDITNVCVGDVLNLLAFGSGGGTWSSSNPAAAAVSPTGAVYGVAEGVATITFTRTTGCFATYAVTVNNPPVISGTASLCRYGTTTLSAVPAGGIWVIGASPIASVDMTTGVVTGATAGTVAITYGFGSCAVSTTLTVYPFVAPIAGSPVICSGKTATLTGATAGGEWSSTNALSVSVDSATGVINGVAPGTATISYSIPGNGCIRTLLVTVHPTPAPITGASTLCLGTPSTLSDTTSGGTWTSGALSTVAIGSASGIATGVAGGTAVITYSLPTGCIAVKTVTVTPHSILGVSSVTKGSTITLSNTTTGGAWGSSNTDVATVGASSGIVTGVTAGTAIMTYEVAGGCRATRMITVNPPLGVSDITSSGVSVFPNPTTGALNIIWNGGTEDAAVVITDVTGRNVLQSAITIGQAAARLNAAQLAAGVYFISIRSEHVSYSGKISVQ